MHVRRTILLAAAVTLAARASAEDNATDAQQPPPGKSQSWIQKDEAKARQLGREGVNAGKRGAAWAGKEVNAGGQAANAKVVGTRTVTGRVADVRPEEVTVSRSGGAPLKLRVTRSTKVTVHGQSASATSLQQGDEVRASYAESGGAATAMKIDVTGSAPSTGAGSASGSGGAASPGAGTGATRTTR